MCPYFNYESDSVGAMVDTAERELSAAGGCIRAPFLGVVATWLGFLDFDRPSPALGYFCSSPTTFSFPESHFVFVFFPLHFDWSDRSRKRSIDGSKRVASFCFLPHRL